MRGRRKGVRGVGGERRGREGVGVGARGRVRGLRRRDSGSGGRGGGGGRGEALFAIETPPGACKLTEERRESDVRRRREKRGGEGGEVMVMIESWQSHRHKPDTNWQTGFVEN